MLRFHFFRSVVPQAGAPDNLQSRLHSPFLQWLAKIQGTREVRISRGCRNFPDCKCILIKYKMSLKNVLNVHYDKWFKLCCVNKWWCFIFTACISRFWFYHLRESGAFFEHFLFCFSVDLWDFYYIFIYINVVRCLFFGSTGPDVSRWLYLRTPLLPSWDREPKILQEIIITFGRGSFQLLQLRCFQVQKST